MIDVQVKWAARQTLWWYNLGGTSRTKMTPLFSLSKMYSRKYRRTFYVLHIGRLSVYFYKEVTK